VDFNHDTKAGPWVEVECLSDCGWGGRLRLWHLRTTAATQARNTDPHTTLQSAGPLPGLALISPDPNNLLPFMPNIPNEAFRGPVPASLLGATGSGSDQMVFRSNLKIDVIDLECTRTADNCRWLIQLAAGARYAHISQRYSAGASSPGGSFPIFLRDADDPEGELELDTFRMDPNTALVDSVRRFNGAGPTSYMEVRFRLLPSGLSLFGSLRGSLLVGRTTQKAALSNAFSGSILHDGPEDTDSSLVASYFRQKGYSSEATGWTEVIPVGEFQLGATYDCCTGGYRPFLEAAFVGQEWWGAGNNTTEKGDLSLLGLKVTAGVRF
jgi:hypothetical protein